MIAASVTKSKNSTRLSSSYLFFPQFLTIVFFCARFTLVEFNVILALVALLIGCLVGLTGVGAGALMTPALIIFFGVSPAVAIATDLLYASATKVVGGLAHLRNGGVQWKVLRRLWLGGMVGVVVGVFGVLSLVETNLASEILRIPLALVVLVAAVSLLYRGFTRPRDASTGQGEFVASDARATLAGSAGIGLAVSLTSVGAGALGMALLAKVSPRGTPPKALVGTDLLFAVPIALVAGLSYFFGGLVDLELLVNLLVGSIPGVLLGSVLASRAPARILSVIIGVALIAAAGGILRSLFV